MGEFSAHIIVQMRLQDFDKLTTLLSFLRRGGYPDLGHPHSKAGYRYSIGRVCNGERTEAWRENLGHEKLAAQQRAREMALVWITHVINECKAREMMIDAYEPTPLDREAARAWAFNQADKALRRSVEAKLDDTVAAAQTHELGKLRVVTGQSSSSLASSTMNSSVTRRDGVLDLTLHAAARRWLSNLQKRAARGDVSEVYVNRVEISTLPRFYEMIEDCDLARVAKPELDDIRLAFQCRKKSDGSLRSRGTIKTELGHVRTMFNWLDESELWPSPPRKWEKYLRPVFRSDDHDTQDVKAKKHDTYTLEELCKAYGVAGYSMRLWMLCVLNFGWGQTEIATSRKVHFRDAHSRRVARYRHKRRPGAEPVPGRWQAWPETWDAADQRMAKTTNDLLINPKGLAFLTTQNKPLVRIQARRVYDVIKDSWKETCNRAGIRNRGFYLLRHTGINMVKRIAGGDIADLYCQHAPESMTDKHYANADWRKLRKALRRLRRNLQPMFDAVAKAMPEKLTCRDGNCE